jgi:DNA-binding LacI/PurR family transcriptional regulator
VGIAVPSEMSLISFDNSASITPLPVSTVDFGFGNLGYSAFHLIYGDVTIHRDRAGNVAGRPVVIHRGSIGPPRSGDVALMRRVGK